VQQNWDLLIDKLPTDSGASLPYVAAGYCDATHRQDVENFFSGRSTKYTGGPPILTQVLEGIDLCVAYKNAQEASVAEFLKAYKPAQSAGGGSKQRKPKRDVCATSSTRDSAVGGEFAYESVHNP